MALAGLLPEAKALYRRAIRACRAIPVKQVDQKMEYNVKVAAHQLFRSTQSLDEGRRRLADGESEYHRH
jgi:hypothetical protein